jgi:hypothetical protein
VDPLRSLPNQGEDKNISRSFGTVDAKRLNHGTNKGEKFLLVKITFIINSKADFLNN